MKSKFNVKLGVLLLAMSASALVSFDAQAQSYANTNDAGTIIYFGAPDTSNYGQVFQAPGGSLQSFSFFNNDANIGDVQFFLTAFNGQSTGPLLFSTQDQTVSSINGNGFYEHTFSGINTSLTAGSTYIAYETIYGVANPPSNVGFAGSNESPLGGAFEYLNNSGQNPVDGGTFSTFVIPNVQYDAEFGSSAVPEPSTWAMMLLGLAGFGLVAYRRRDTRVARSTIAA